MLAARDIPVGQKWDVYAKDYFQDYSKDYFQDYFQDYSKTIAGLMCSVFVHWQACSSLTHKTHTKHTKQALTRAKTKKNH